MIESLMDLKDRIKQLFLEVENDGVFFRIYERYEFNN